MDALVVQVQAQVEAQVDVVEYGSTDARILNHFDVTHHVVLEEEVEAEVLNFEIEC